VADDEVEVIPGVVGLREFETRPFIEPTTGHEVVARVRFDSTTRQYECEEVRILRGDRTEITSESLRSVPLDAMVWGSIRIALLTGWPEELAKQFPDLGPATWLRDLPNPDGREPWGRKMPEGLAKEGPTDRVLQWVAQYYRLSVALHEQPTSAIQEVMGVSRATAGRWVSAARAKGYLGAAIHGKAGERA
jgi:hypothetical protein